MRLSIILFLVLFCHTQCYSGSGIEQKALENEQEKVELNSELNNKVMKTIKEKIKYFTFLDLCFAKIEFLELIKNDTSFRDAWKEKVANIPPPRKEYFNIQNQHFKFFNECFSKEQTNGYSEQVAFLIENCPKAVGENYLSESDYGYLAAKYPKADNLAELYMVIFDLLVLDANNFLNEINKDPEAISGFHKWLSDISEWGITTFGSAPYEIVEKKRDYIISSLEKVENPLAQEALKTLKSAPIKIID